MFGADRGIDRVRDISYSCCDFIGGVAIDAIPYGLTPDLRQQSQSEHHSVNRQGDGHTHIADAMAS